MANYVLKPCPEGKHPLTANGSPLKTMPRLVRYYERRYPDLWVEADGFDSLPIAALEIALDLACSTFGEMRGLVILAAIPFVLWSALMALIGYLL